jgi:hypothetical protein
MDVCQQDAEIIACGAQESGIHVRRSGGMWRNLDFRRDGVRVAFDPSSSNIVYFSAQRGVPLELARTLNAGAPTPTVESLGRDGLSGRSPFITVLTLAPGAVGDPAKQRTVFVAGSEGLIPQLFRSADGGQKWKRVDYTSGDLKGTPFIPEGDVTALEFARDDAKHVYLGTSLGAVYRSKTGGATGEDWSRINDDRLFGVPISALATDPRDPDQLWVTYAGEGVTAIDRPYPLMPSHQSHVYRTKDGGKKWEDASGSWWWGWWSLPDVPTSAVVVDDQKLHPGHAYVGTDVGVYVTTDGGASWARLDGVPMAPVTRLRLHWAGRWLFAATMGRGVFRCKLA